VHCVTLEHLGLECLDLSTSEEPGQLMLVLGKLKKNRKSDSV
jgi:hypothetical protein